MYIYIYIYIYTNTRALACNDSLYPHLCEQVRAGSCRFMKVALFAFVDMYFLLFVFQVQSRTPFPLLPTHPLNSCVSPPRSHSPTFLHSFSPVSLPPPTLTNNTMDS